MDCRDRWLKHHWRKWTLGLVLSGAVAWYWYLYSKHLNTAKLVSVQMCLIEGEQLDPYRSDELIEVIANQLINKKLAGDTLIERVALKNAITDGLTCEPLKLL
ncbi:hypothetical protein SG34_028830 [Thalassomonas viridans]|uniref:Uncharacterized protein n=1 Tax=Thalassomonas viridans TaxID=137584 RepID=A0AAF0C8Z3_9GAMM|nr:hypothetical protein [Thalassomonas viridans]WDE05248.1 hypothetical protein SG34_028830 [Thalassomonas viridans]